MLGPEPEASARVAVTDLPSLGTGGRVFDTGLSPGCPQTWQFSCLSLLSAGSHNNLLGVVFKEKPFWAVYVAVKCLNV